MTVKVVTKQVNHCVCELCGNEWDSTDLTLPKRCPPPRGCGSYRWNGVDRRRTDSIPASNGKKKQA